MPTAKKSAKSETLTIPPIKQHELTLRIIGTTPLLQNRMSNKVKNLLLAGGRKKTAAQRIEMKHHPLDEFRNACETVSGDYETAIGLKVTAVKGAMCSAALETAGVTKTSAQRLLFMPGDYFSLYGTPQLRMDVVRSADINKTPDIRSWPVFPKWGAEVRVKYITPQLNGTAVTTLLCNAGIVIGIGDGRQEKGKLSFGCFRVIGGNEKDDEWDDLVKNHGTVQQLKALENPEYSTPETAELMEFYLEEMKRREVA
jgi:hypothetical protein